MKLHHITAAVSASCYICLTNKKREKGEGGRIKKLFREGCNIGANFFLIIFMKFLFLVLKQKKTKIK